MSLVPDACRILTLWFGSEEVRKCISEPICVSSTTCVSHDFAALHLYDDNNKWKISKILPSMVCCFVSWSICEHKQLDPLSNPIKRNDSEYKFAEKRTHGKMEISFFMEHGKKIRRLYGCRHHLVEVVKVHKHVGVPFPLPLKKLLNLLRPFRRGAISRRRVEKL